MNNELEEVLTYLEKRDDYLIWAGFAQFAHLGIKHSADIDIYTKNKEVKIQISANFQSRGWQLRPHPEMNPGWFWDKLQKQETTFDIVYTQASSELMFPAVVEIEVYDCKLRFLSKEWLFLTKMGQFTWPSRTEEKRRRDMETINLLRKSIDSEKLRQIATSLPDSYWLRGEV